VPTGITFKIFHLPQSNRKKYKIHLHKSRFYHRPLIMTLLKLLNDKRTQFAQSKSDHQSGRSQETARTIDVSLDSSLLSIGSIEQAGQGGNAPNVSIKRPPRSTFNSSARSLTNERDRHLTEKQRPQLEHKLSYSGRLPPGNRELSTASEVVGLLKDLRQADTHRQLVRNVDGLDSVVYCNSSTKNAATLRPSQMPSVEKAVKPHPTC
jgi:hypothetical protein